jgi:hypothetical protein
MRNRAMKYRAIAGAAALLLPLCGYALPECSLNMVRGSWAYEGRGTVMMSVPGSPDPVPVPIARLGIANIDYQGRYTVHATTSAGGRIEEVAFTGSIQVNADCTANATYTAGGVEGADRLIVLDNGSEMRSMPTKSPLGPFAGMFHFRRLAWGNAECTSDMVRGAYAGWREGTLMMPVPGQPQPAPVPFSALVTFTVQSGTVTAASTASMGGSIVEFEFPKGLSSLQVNPDCTATMNWSAVSKQFPGVTFTGALKYVVVDRGNGLIGLETQGSSGSSVVIETDNRVSMMP